MNKVVIQPNRSMSNSARTFFLAVLTLNLLLIALGFYSVGLWMVLPFAGLELVAVFTAFYWCSYKCRYQEVISVDQDNVLITAGYGRIQHSCTFNRFWTTVLLQRSKLKGYPDRLMIRSAGKEVEVGTCLTSDEKQALLLRLTQLVSVDRFNREPESL